MGLCRATGRRAGRVGEMRYRIGPYRDMHRGAEGLRHRDRHVVYTNLMTGLDMGVDWSKAMFGQNARHVAVRLALTRMGPVTNHGRQQQLYVVVGYVVGNAAHPDIDDCGMELIVGDMVIRPHREATGRNFIGSGAEAMLSSDALDPDAWDVQLGPKP